MDYLFQDGGKPKKTNSKTKTSTKTGTKTTKSKTSTKTGTKTTKSKTGTKTGTKTTKSKSSSKKGGNFFGTVGDLVAPTGWGPFATAAALVGLDRVDAALRRGKSTKSSAKKGGMRGGTKIRDILYKLYLKRREDAKEEVKLKSNMIINQGKYKKENIDRTNKVLEKYKEEILKMETLYQKGTEEEVREYLKLFHPNSLQFSIGNSQNVSNKSAIDIERFMPINIKKSSVNSFR